MMQGIPIGEAANHSGVKVPTMPLLRKNRATCQPRSAVRAIAVTMGMPICAVWCSSAMRGIWDFESRRSAPCSPCRMIPASLARPPT